MMWGEPDLADITVYRLLGNVADFISHILVSIIIKVILSMHNNYYLICFVCIL